MLPLAMELLLLRRLCRLVSSGSRGWSPVALAKRFSISVRETTPERWPDMCTPGMVGADTDEPEDDAWWKGGIGCGGLLCGICRTAGWVAGVGGPEEEGDAESTIHIR